MRYLEVRCHTMRTKPGEHLSQAGVDLARRVGTTMGPFADVVTTRRPWAFETAIAMGFAVDSQLAAFPPMPADGAGAAAWDAGYAAWCRAVRQDGVAARYAHQEAACWRAIVAAVPDGASALLVTHGGVIEAGAAACLSRGEHTRLAAGCSYCEGIRLAWDGTAWVGLEVLPVGPARPEAPLVR